MTAKKKCVAAQHNPRQRNFDCRLDDSAHSIHIDSVTGTRWGMGKYPRRWSRRWAKKYANPKLAKR